MIYFFVSSLRDSGKPDENFRDCSGWANLLVAWQDNSRTGLLSI
jgi:hypothetical protein